MLKRDRRRFAKDLLWGVRAGLLMALAYGVVAFGGLALASDSASRSLAFRAIALYPIGGLIAGAIFGLLRPLLRWHFFAMCVGAVALIPAAIAVSIPLAAALDLATKQAMGAAAMTGTILGAAIGHWYHVDSGSED